MGLIRMFFVFVLLVSSFIFSGCNTSAHPPAGQTKQKSQNKVDPGYELLEDIKYSKVKRMLKIRLPHRMTEEQVKKLSRLIRKQTPEEYKYLSIWYYIPEVPLKNGIWANAQFYDESLQSDSQGPENIKILCLTVPCYNELLKAPLPDADRILGAWIVERQYVSSRKVIYLKDGLYYCNELGCRYENGGNDTPQTASLNEKKFVRRKNPTNEFYLINQDGDLELHSEDGCYAIGKRLSIQ